MTDDKIKTKKAILGELESISSLLRNDESHDEQGNDEEPPLLTAMADDAIDFDDDYLDEDTDSPLLTDALNSVIDAIEGRIDEDDIPTLADSISTSDDEEQIFDDESGLDLDADEETDQEDDIVARALKNNLHRLAPTLESNQLAAPDNAPATASTEEDLLPELIIDEDELFDQEEFAEKWDSLATAKNESVIEQPNEKESRFDSQSKKVDADFIDDIPTFGHTATRTTKAETKKTVTNLGETKSVPVKKVSQEQNSSDTKAQRPTQALDAKQIAAVREKALELDLPKAEHQPSLFDKKTTPTPSLFANTSATSSASADKKNSLAPPITQSTTTRSNTINANNPFLPKHIRDRLHTNRTLQQEIDESPYSQANFTSSTSNYQTKNSGASSSPEKSSDEKLVDELVNSYIAKIEPELRDKIRNLIKQEKQSSDK